LSKSLETYLTVSVIPKRKKTDKYKDGLRKMGFDFW